METIAIITAGVLMIGYLIARGPLEDRKFAKMSDQERLDHFNSTRHP